MARNNKQAGISFIGILVALAVVALLYFLVLKNYFKNPSGATKETQKVLAEQGIDVSNLPATVQKANEAVNKANETSKKLENELKEQK